MRCRRFVGSATIVTLLAALPLVHGQPSTLGTVRESESGVPFPVVMTPPGATASHRLVGTGIREATWLRLNVYAFGLYVDADGATAALAEFKGQAPSALRQDARFGRRLLDLGFGMALRLVMTRSVEGDDVAEAFDDVLRPRMLRAGRSADGTDAGSPHAAAHASTALSRLRDYLGADRVRRGTEVVFSCDPAGRLTVRVADARPPSFTSRALCRVLFDAYVGEDPVSRDGKRDVVAGFAALLAAASSRGQAYFPGAPLTAYTRLTMPVFS